MRHPLATWVGLVFLAWFALIAPWTFVAAIVIAPAWVATSAS